MLLKMDLIMLTLKATERLLCMLNMLERKHGIVNLDSHQREFLEIIVRQNAAGQIITPNDLVDLNLTSRSSTYRKLADLRELNLIKEDWIDGQCQLSAADGTKEFINSLQNGIQFITAQ
ncbi:MAG: hypothetical protein ACOYLL_06245 [Beijerinckiaceae bacterium]|jgi:hypothetical protein